MKKFTWAAITAIALLPTASLADFTGAYAGLAVGSVGGSGESDFGSGANDFDLNDSTAFSGFAGYQQQYGTFVYGGELVLSSAPDAQIEGSPDSGVDGAVIDIKGRAGYAFSEAVMGYATYGFTTLTVDDGVNEQGDADGYIIGAGFDYLATPNILLGAELTRRDVSGDTDNSDFDIEIDSLALRASFKF